MTEKRYYKRDYEELYYIIDSNTISEEEFDEKMEYDGYTAFEDSLTGEEIVDLLNENEQLKQSHKELGTAYDELVKLGNSLEKENEQLKQQLNEVKAYNNWLVSVLQDSGAIVEIKKGDME